MARRRYSVLGLGVLLLAASAAAQDAAQPLGDPHLAPGERTVTLPVFDGVGDIVTRLNDDLRAGKATLKFDPANGYLRALLDRFGVLPESQSVVFSQPSLQKRFITPHTPRALFFSDDVSIGFIPGARLLEIAVAGEGGAVFYALEQRETQTPQLTRRDECLTCHISRAGLSVPGLLLRSIPTDADGRPMPWLGNVTPDHTTPFEDRWAGWYVTGKAGAARHMGNLPIADPAAAEAPLNPPGSALATLSPAFDTKAYPADTSDIAALLVMTHQMRMTNLIVRAGIDARALARVPQEVSQSYGEDLLASDARAVVDYMLFVDEASLAGEVQTSSAFAEKFAARGPLDKKGRSLRQLQLSGRLLKYPCSYMIYSAAFTNLPVSAREAIYARLWAVLSGADPDPRYATLSSADRRAIIEILHDTKSDLPAVFR